MNFLTTSFSHFVAFRFHSKEGSIQDGPNVGC